MVISPLVLGQFVLLVIVYDMKVDIFDRGLIYQRLHNLYLKGNACDEMVAWLTPLK